MKRALFVTAFFLLCAARVGAQVNIGDSCYTIDWGGFSSNPDSILVDTCLSTRAHPVFWVKRGYVISFDVNAIPLGYASPDSDLEVGWESIDTSFPDIRNGFKRIYDSIGPFLLKKQAPNDTSSVGLGAREFLLIFENYVLGDSVENSLKAIPAVHSALEAHWATTGDVLSQDATEQTSLDLYPNPALNQLKIFMRGFTGVGHVELIDIDGRTVRSNLTADGIEETSFDLCGLEPGNFCIRAGSSLGFFIHLK